MEPIIIENLQIWPEDLGKMNWHDATKAATALGEGWRLPTKEEFENILYPNRTKIPELKEELYWSSTDYDSIHAWTFLFFNGNAYANYKNYTDYVRAVRDFTGNAYANYKNYPFYVRAVRDFTGDMALELLLKEF